MKYPQILETLTTTPLLVTPGAADALRQMFEQHATMSAADFKAAREGTGPCGEAVELDQMTIENGLACIPVNGPLGIRLGSFEKGAGAVDYLDIMADINTAAADPTVQNILLYFDSPGGMMSGLPETGQMIADCAKPIYAFVPAGGLCASAAYWLAACCDGIFACPSAQIGSIGVYCAYMDLSKMAADKGIKVKVFSSGIYKGMGIPGTSLSAEQEAYLQDSVMQLAAEFYDHVTSCREGAVPDEAMQGQTFRAEEAVDNGLVDDVIQNEDTMKSFLSV
jgi:signal peptide peptidase SppA